MNKFYKLSISFQWTLAVIMFILLGLVFFLWFDVMMVSSLGILLIFIITPIAQFLMTPFFKLLCVYKYLSPMLLVYAPTNSRYDLHNGTSFDYMMVYERGSCGKKWQSKLLVYFIDGLLEIIKLIEDGSLPATVEIRGSSYFFSKRTAQKFGFEILPTGWAEKFNIVINYLDLIWMYSLSKGRIVFPSIRNVCTATTSGEKLINKKQDLIRLLNYLERKQVSK